MKTTVRFLIVSLLFTLIGTASYAQVDMQEHEVSPFSRLTIAGTLNVELHQGSSYLLQVEGTEADRKSVVVGAVQDGSLRLSARGDNDALVRITTPSLEHLVVQDASTALGIGTFVADTFHLESKGAATVTMSIVSTDLTAKLTGAATATVSGTAEILTLELGGASQARFDSLVINRASIRLTGATLGRLNVTEKVEGRVSGMASVVFVSEPVINEVNVTSMASGLSQVLNETIDVTIEGEAKEMEVREVVKEARKTRESGRGKFNGHFEGFELGINTFMTSKGSFNLEGEAKSLALNIPSSRVWNVNLLQTNLPLIRQQFGIVTGMGFEFNNYHFEENIRLAKKDGKTVIQHHSDDIELSRNKLTATYLKVPFMLEFQTNKGPVRQRFHIAGGVNLGLRLGTSARVKYSDGGATIRERTRDRYNLNPYRVAAAGRIGFGRLNFFAEYNLLPFFEKDKGPEVYAASFGIVLTGFN